MDTEKRQQLSSRVADRKEGREMAVYVIDSLGSAVENRVVSDSFLEEMQRILHEKHPPAAAHGPFTDLKSEFVAARNSTLSFGAYVGVPLYDVPLSYLKWLHDSTQQTTELLKKYLQVLPLYEKTALEHRNRTNGEPT